MVASRSSTARSPGRRCSPSQRCSWRRSVWWDAKFGDLDYAKTMRVVVPGSTLTAIGFQTILSSFFLSVLGMQRPSRRMAQGGQRLSS